MLTIVPFVFEFLKIYGQNTHFNITIITTDMSFADNIQLRVRIPKNLRSKSTFSYENNNN